MHTIYRIATGVLLLGASYGVAQGQEASSTTPIAEPLSGVIEAMFPHDETAGTWRLTANGSFSGNGASVRDLFLYGADAKGALIARQPLDPESIRAQFPSASPFALDIPLTKPDPDWAEIGLGMHLMDAQGSSTEVLSGLFPIIWRQPVLIDHAINGSTLAASNYESGGIPAGIGIPHTLINGIPEGDYYAVVFFDGLIGCPSGNYEINSFRANAYWGYDIRDSLYSKAFSSIGGGCMQKFHVDPAKGGDWLWGALSNTETSSAIADAKGIPAFAICASAAACDPIIPQAAPISLGSTTDEKTVPSAVSNVLFLPGIKGSELYEDNPLCLIPDDSCGAKLWLPLADNFVPELFMDAQGKSKRNLFIRDGDIMASAFGQHFYDSFVRMLDRVRAEGTFGNGWSWKAVAYDWRLSLPDIIHDGAQRGTHIYFGESTSTPYIEQELRALASTSPTHKVTIIAHSNGGLVAKALMQSLGDTLAAEFIDSIIFIGVPQSGAPRALGALLYGDAEGIPGIKGLPDAIMSAAHAREFGLNSPMAYHLLPSARYLSARQPEHPLVKFEDSALTAPERSAYGASIDTEDELDSFALAQDGDRTMPPTNDLTSANVLNPTLLTYGKNEHDSLDSWEPPPGIALYELGGYGADTISGIDLYPSAHKDGSTSLSYRPMFIEDGDGTVPIISALMLNVSERVHAFFLDLAGMRTSSIAYSHANLLEAPDVQATILSLLKGSAVFPSTAHAMDIPSTSIPQKKFGFFVHSPVSITVTDGNGESVRVGTDGTDENIPGSTAGTFGEVKYVLVPADYPPYTLALSGEGNGSFTLDLQQLVNDEVVASSTVADVSVTHATRAILTLPTSALADASSLSVDENGDGVTDISAAIALGSTTFPLAEPSSPSKASASTRIRRLSGLPLISVFTKQAFPAQQNDAPHTVSPDTPVTKASSGGHQASSTRPLPQAIPVAPQSTGHHSSISRLRSLLLEALRFVIDLLRTLGVRLKA